MKTLHTLVQKTLESDKRPILFRFAAYDAPAISQENSRHTLENADLVINISSNMTDAKSRLQDWTLEFGAYYNQRLFASSRISTILAQLLQIIEHAACNPEESIGRLDLITPQQRNLLPDPTRGLDWSSFRGGIHDIFASNAQAHPDRLCVIETLSRSSPRREFTYKQINEASNILGHHLVQSGIQRGEVVMVYAHRGVDLVVAVMGVLKAGATFSVIDPAYPPDRQNIYLEVAKPRALVVIDKATKEAGELTDKVHSFIKENLQLRTEVPALAIQGDGTLFGGHVDGKDVLSEQTSSKHKLPGIVIGPDSTPTLSFTSGSEGRPKGVRGRHFSLAYYFPWMSKTFTLSQNDRFTMLSGVAHDIQSSETFSLHFS